jgi:DUF1009 family protein
MIHEAHPDAMVITLAGIPSELETVSHRHRLEKIGGLFDAMREQGVERMIFAGALTRPAFDPTTFDAEMMQIAPRLMQAMSLGDDGLLRTVIQVFEEQGFSVVGVKDVLPSLVAESGLAVGPAPSDVDEGDVARATEILRGIAALDIGQGCVVAGGQCLGLETVQGTDALLGFVASTPERYRNRAKGVYVKAAKTGQDLRIDMPAIGPQTIAAVAKAGLAGLVVEADHVLLLDRDATLAAVTEAGLFLQTRGL